jgi:uncharacterized protein (TIGR02284 family)
METKIELNPSTLEGIKDLIRANSNSARILSRAAKGVLNSQVASLCIGLREQRRRDEGELKYYVLINGERTRRIGTWAVGIRHDWLSLRTMVSRGNPGLILNVVERQEAGVKRAYERVLKRTAGSAVNDVLLKQYEVLKQGLKRVQDLRAEFRSK